MQVVDESGVENPINLCFIQIGFFDNLKKEQMLVFSCKLLRSIIEVP